MDYQCFKLINLIVIFHFSHFGSMTMHHHPKGFPYLGFSSQLSSEADAARHLFGLAHSFFMVRYDVWHNFNAFRRDTSMLLLWKIHYHQLTLHTESIGTVLRLEYQPLAVLSSVFRCWIVALPPPPLGTLCPTSRPLTPLCPHTVH